MSNGRFLGRCKCRPVCTGPCDEPSKADPSTPIPAVCLPPSTRRLPDSALLGPCTPRLAASIISSVSLANRWMIGSLLTCSASSRCHHRHLSATTIISLPPLIATTSLPPSSSHCRHRHLIATTVISLPPSSHCHSCYLIATNVISLPPSHCHCLSRNKTLSTGWYCMCTIETINGLLSTASLHGQHDQHNIY